MSVILPLTDGLGRSPKQVVLLFPCSTTACKQGAAHLFAHE